MIKHRLRSVIAYQIRASLTGVFRSGSLLILFLSLFGKPSKGQFFDPQVFENQVQDVVKRVSPACVKISGYDTVRNTATAGKFSGVVVSADGLILTAAHAATPNRVYKIYFPNGQEALAVGLGRMGSTDAALIQIKSAGTWPYAEMGWSYNLKEHQACLSISFPGSLETAVEPVVRMGYIAEPVARGGMIRTTCLMEPGDSGGPLFDMFGRVIGIHSRIEVALDFNMEIPVDQFRKHWNSLKSPISYRSRELPEPEEIGSDPLDGKQMVLEDLAVLPGYFTRQASAVGPSIVSISNSDTGKLVALGTIISPARSNKKYIVSKASLIEKAPFIVTDKGRRVKAEILAVDDSSDLVVLKADIRGKAIELRNEYSDTLKKGEVGRFVISTSPDEKVRVGVFSAAYLRVPGRSGIGFLGVMSEQVDGRLRLNEVVPNSPAEKCSIKKGDLLEAVNDMAVASPEELTNAMARFRPGDSVRFRLNRSDSVFYVKVALGKRPEASRHAADRFEEGKSDRKDGFPHVFVHDTPVRPEECGGPVVDTDGNFLGINIARLSRTSTLAVPYSAILRLVGSVEAR